MDISASFVAGERAIRDHILHGMAMLSGVSTNGIGIASVAPDARLCSVKVLTRTGSGTFSDVIAGILYVGIIRAVYGANVEVANMSLGAPVPRNDPEVQPVSGEAAVIESELPGDQSPAELTACILRSADPLPRPWLTANGRINVLRGARCASAPDGKTVASQ